MKILLVNIKYIPEIASSAHLYHDMAKKFTKLGHEVHVIASYPRDFNLSDEDKGKDFPDDEIIDGIHVHRAKFKFQNRDNILLRGIEHFYLPRLFFKKYKELDMDFDVVLLFIPPLFIYRLGKKIRKHDGTPFVSNYQDIHPQELVDGDIVTNPIWIKILEYIERKSYKAPDYITVMSPNGKKLIEERGGENVECIYNGMDIEKYKEDLPEDDFKEEEGIKDKTMVTYAGILNPFQGLGNMLDAAKLLEDKEDLIFYIIGDGMRKDTLKKRIEEENITNVKMMPFQPREEYFKIINSSDINVVSLDKRMTAPCIPGKVSDLLGVQNPIIAPVPEDNDTADIMEDYNCGIRIEPGNPEAFAEAVMRIKRNPEIAETMKENAWNFLIENMNMDKNVKRYVEIFEEIT